MAPESTKKNVYLLFFQRYHAPKNSKCHGTSSELFLSAVIDIEVNPLKSEYFQSTNADIHSHSEKTSAS
jgi:hypothetical protein